MEDFETMTNLYQSIIADITDDYTSLGGHHTYNRRGTGIRKRKFR